MAHSNPLSGHSRAKGLLLGLGYGDSICQPPNHAKLSDFGDPLNSPRRKGTRTKLAQRQATSIVERKGFDGTTTATALSQIHSETDLDSLHDITVYSLESIADGEAWDDIARANPVTTPNFDPLTRNCVLAPAYRSFPDELEYVTHLSTKISSDRDEVAKASATITAILAELIEHEQDEGHLQLLEHFRRGYALDRDGYLRTDCPNIHEDVSEFRDTPRGVAQLEPLQSAGGTPESFLRAVLLVSFGTDDCTEALAAAAGSEWHPEVMTPLVGSIMGARFGVEAFPEDWLENYEEASSLPNTGFRLLKVDDERSSFPDHDSTIPVVHGRPIVGPTYLKSDSKYSGAGSHRPKPAPHTHSETLSRHLSPKQAGFFDWEHRAQRGLVNEINIAVSGSWVRVPEYTLAESVDDLPEQDVRRLQGIVNRACENAQEVVEVYGETWNQTLHQDLLGEKGNDRIGSHLGYMIRSITRHLSNLENVARPRRFLHSWDPLISMTNLLVLLEDYMAVTNDLMYWSEEDWEHYAGLSSRIRFTVGAIRLSLESLRALVIRHPEYEIGAWEREGTRDAKLR